jgi:hypothetical protein
MKAASHDVHAHCNPTVFTVRLRGQVHRCALSDEALYLLSQKMDPRLDRIDAYLLLKRRVAIAAQACLDDGADALPSVMEARHVMRGV